MVGPLSADLVAEVERLPRSGETVSSRGLRHGPGGTAVVQAVAAARLEARVSVYGCVGLDSFGDAILTLLSKGGIDIGGIERFPGAPTGASVVFVDTQGTPLAAQAPGANGRLDATYIGRNLLRIRDADAVLVALTAPAAAEALLGSLASSCPVVASHPPAEDPALPWARLDFLVGARDEFLRSPAPSGGTLDEATRAGQAFLGRGVRHAVVVGGDGVYLVEAGGVTRFPAHTGSLANLTLAVDAFSAALAVRLAAGGGLYEAVGFACAAASLASARAHGLDSLPTVGEVLALLARFAPHLSRPGG